MEGDLNGRRATAPGKPSRDYLGVVEDEEIAGAQQTGQIQDLPVLEPACLWNEQQAGSVARLAWVGRDQFARQGEIKIVEMHRSAR